MRSILSGLAVSALLIAVSAGVALASDDHGGPKAVTVSPRVEARVGTHQFVLVYASRQLFEDRKFQFFGNVQRTKFDEPRLALFVEDYATAKPVSGAEIEAMVNFLPGAMTEISPGVYVTEEMVLGGGRNEVEISYTIGAESGDVSMLLLVAGGETSGTSASAAAVSAVKPTAIPSWVFVGGAVLIYLAAAGLFLIRRNRVIQAEPSAHH
ncbi:MAG: hypothetical protein P1U88_23140 [Thalassobaculaceae bacterium]|nr:hypothetical protein [Thalassobaculaceae bacterium]